MFQREKTPPAHNGVIHASLGREEVQGSSHVFQAPLSPAATQGEKTLSQAWMLSVESFPK